MTTRNNIFFPFILFQFGKRPSFLLGLFFIFGLPSITLAAFLAPQFEKLDKSELQARYEKRGAKVSGADLENAFFYREYLTLSLSIHRSGAVSQWLVESCEDAERSGFADLSDAGVARLTCAIIFAEQVEGASPWEKSRYLKSTLQLYEAASPKATPEDKLYVEGRIFLALPEYPGIKRTRAVLAFQFLHRLKPEATSSQYFLAKGFERVGNRNSFEQWKSKAVAANDRRAQLEFERPLRLERAMNDGLGYGFSPRLFFSPNGGFGGQAGYTDDRMFDQDRAGFIGGFATSRGQWGIEGRYKDFELVSPTGVLAEAKVFSGEQDSFDLGPKSDLNRRFTPEINKQEGRIGLQRGFQRAFALELGWIWFHQTATNSANPARLSAFPDASAVYYSGPYFELGVDTRDSEYLPRRGGFLKVFGNLPTDGLLSPRGFERWKVSGGYFLPGLFRHHVISVQSVAHWVTGNRAPWAAFPRVGTPLKGLREGRFSDRALMEAVIDYSFPMGFGFGLDFFGNAAAVNPTISRAMRGSYELGGGVGLTWNSDVSRAASWQVSLGRFGGESAIVASGSVGL